MSTCIKVLLVEWAVIRVRLKLKVHALHSSSEKEAY